MVIGRSSTNNATAAVDRLDTIVASVLTASTAAHYLARTYTGLGTSAPFAKWGDYARGGSPGFLAGSAALAIPDPVTGGIHVAPVHLHDAVAAIHVRGRMRGFFQL